jgi:hypothetical protein
MKRALVEGATHFELFVGAAVLANNLIVIAELLRRKAARRRRPAGMDSSPFASTRGLEGEMSPNDALFPPSPLHPRPSTWFCYLFATIGLVDHQGASQPRGFAEFRDRN